MKPGILFANVKCKYMVMMVSGHLPFTLSVNNELSLDLYAVFVI